MTEVVGEGSTLELHSTLIPWQIKGRQTLLETPAGDTDSATLSPWQIQTFRLYP
ncbi:MAG TPA: hypothetical protein IGP91_11850 [Thermosynechococcus sp. M46_R2017_013]|nr:hypothetical protein [Thermosynechococcus sp. M46_R2017_013]